MQTLSGTGDRQPHSPVHGQAAESHGLAVLGAHRAPSQCAVGCRLSAPSHCSRMGTGPKRQSHFLCDAGRVGNRRNDGRHGGSRGQAVTLPTLRSPRRQQCPHGSAWLRPHSHVLPTWGCGYGCAHSLYGFPSPPPLLYPQAATGHRAAPRDPSPTATPGMLSTPSPPPVPLIYRQRRSQKPVHRGQLRSQGQRFLHGVNRRTSGLRETATTEGIGVFQVLHPARDRSLRHGGTATAAAQSPQLQGVAPGQPPAPPRHRPGTAPAPPRARAPSAGVSGALLGKLQKVKRGPGEGMGCRGAAGGERA